jgi:hypothetical protein
MIGKAAEIRPAVEKYATAGRTRVRFRAQGILAGVREIVLWG